MTPWPDRFGRVLNELRTLRKLSRPDFARTIGVSSSFVGMVEAGKRHVSLPTLQKIAEVLEIPEACILLLAAEVPRGRWYAILQRAQHEIRTILENP